MLNGFGFPSQVEGIETVRPKQEGFETCRLRVLFAAKNKFLFVLCLCEPFTPEVLDHMWAEVM